jgi:MFS family permease
MNYAQRNIYMLYLIKIGKWFMLTMPIIVLFFREHGLGMQDVLVLQAIYSISVVVMEIPSGYLGDIWGRKNTLILGTILGTIGFVIYSFSYGFYGFLFAQLALGAAQSCVGGSDSAMLYDSLKSINREDKYLKYEGRVLSIGNFAETLAAVIGGALAEISLRTPFYWQILVAFIAIPAAIALVEPERNDKIIKGGFSHIMGFVKYSLITNIQLRNNILFSGIIGCATLSMAWLIQPYLEQYLHFSEYQIGITWAALNLTIGLTTLVAHRIDKMFSQKTIVSFIVISTSACYFFTGLFESIFVLPVLFFFYFTRGIATPVLKDYINRMCEAHMRATVLSVRNFVIRILFACFGPILGWYADLFSLKHAFVLSGVVFLFLGIVTGLLYVIQKSRTKI